MIEIRDGKASITFHDVAAYFPEEEWKLLQDWQKEIYKNVMKDIHRALIALGHKIINRGNILQIKKREELHILNPNYSERRANLKDMHSSCQPAATPDIFLRIKPSENLQTRDLCGPKQMNLKDSLVKGPTTTTTTTTTSFLSRTKEEKAPCSSEPINKENTSTISKPTDDPVITSVFSLRLEREEEAAIAKSSEPEKIGPEKPIITSVFSLNIKCEEDTEFEKEPEERSAAGHPFVKDAYSGSFKYVDGIRVKIEPFPEEETASDSTRDSAKRNHDDPVRYFENAAGKVKMEAFQSSQQKANCSSSLWSGMNSEQAGNTLYSTTPRLEGSRIQGYESNLRNVGLIPELPNDPHRWRPFKCTECEAYFSLTEDLYRHEQAHKDQVYHQCTKCEKRFVLKEELTAHLKTHTVLCIPEVAPVGYINLEGKVTSYSYQCTKCDKSFSLKESLNVHLKTHVEVKPYQCTMCEKSFFQEVIFIRHLKTHSGERPFSCNQCGINFTHKVGLQTHQRRQACKKPYPFPVYTKCFVQLGDRVSSEGTNPDETKNTNPDTPKPYKCTHCEKCFAAKISQIKHERSHTQQN